MYQITHSQSTKNLYTNTCLFNNYNTRILRYSHYSLNIHGECREDLTIFNIEIALRPHCTLCRIIYTLRVSTSLRQRIVKQVYYYRYFFYAHAHKHINTLYYIISSYNLYIYIMGVHAHGLVYNTIIRSLCYQYLYMK